MRSINFGEKGCGAKFLYKKKIWEVKKTQTEDYEIEKLEIGVIKFQDKKNSEETKKS